MTITLPLTYARLNAPSPTAVFMVAMFLILALFACASPRPGGSPPLQNRIKHLPPQIGVGPGPLIGIPGHEVNRNDPP